MVDTIYFNPPPGPTQAEINAAYDPDQALVDAYFRHAYHPDPDAQASAAGYLAQIEAAGITLPDITEDTFEDVTLAAAIDGPVADYKLTEDYLVAAGKPEGLELSPTDPLWVASPGPGGEVLTDPISVGGGLGSIGAIIGLGGVLFAAALLFGKKR